MAEIYLGAPGDGSSAARVAIKVIHQQNASDPEFVRMLIDEARLATQLDHPNIVKTYDLGKEGEQYYIVMEYIDGADLFKVQQRGAVRRQSFPLALCAFITREVTRGLDFAHRLKDQQGRPLYIVHRDISPQNILVSFDGDVKITDFGIAKAAHRAEQTQAGIIKGKYYYMSPEQAMGRLIDARTDVFAAGILLYEMLVGEMLYYDDDIDKLLAIVRKADIVAPSQRRSDIPPALESICMKALRKKPDERFQTAADYGAALDEFLRDFAPDFGATDLGVFVTRMVDGPKAQRDRPRVSASLTPFRDVSSDEHSPTVGLSNDQLERLGIRDENSLIFAPLEKLEALLKAAPAVGGRAQLSGAIPEGGAVKGGLTGGTDSNIQTRRRVLDKNLVIDPELLESAGVEAAPPVASPKRAGEGQRGRGDWSEESTNPAWKEGRDAAKAKDPKPAKKTVIGSSSDDNLDRPTVSTEVSSSLLSSIGSPEDEAHESPTARRPAEAARLAHLSMEIPVLDMETARAAYQSESKRPTRPQRAPAAESAGPPSGKAGSKPPTKAGSRPPAKPTAGAAAKPTSGGPPKPTSGPRPLVFELMPAPAPVDLVISDDGFAQIPAEPKPSAGEPSVELEQSDVDYPASAARPSDGLAADLDAISSESTHFNLPKTAERPSSPSLSGLPSSSSLALPVVPSRSRWSYVLAGLGAAAISAVVTWQLTTGRSGPPVEPSPPDDGGPQLLLFDAPEKEPAPAPLTGPGEPPPPAHPLRPPMEGPTGTAGPPKRADATATATDADELGEIELDSTPTGAEVYVNRKLVGTTPLTLSAQPLASDVKVELRLEGFAKTKKRLKWKGERHLTVSVKLKPGDAAGTDGDAESVAPGAKPPSETTPQN